MLTFTSPPRAAVKHGTIFLSLIAVPFESNYSGSIIHPDSHLPISSEEHHIISAYSLIIFIIEVESYGVYVAVRGQVTTYGLFFSFHHVCPKD